ncbi:hypothetical protein N3K66_006713 [Trichothecium roseum]|uniref:Uncharacterized protein n=1 Tax=Trichothecium roseum TaxID=47278 RepID=A0ACC0UYQ3_9HYPO|nr:hypothetical protein N3K66_006713 [Trichothecium roseum]
MDLSDQYWRLPIITRTLSTLVFAVSLGLHTGLLPDYFTYHPQLIARFPPQIWRLVSCYCITGPALSVVFDTYFCFQYTRQLETGKFSRKEDLLWFLLFIGGVVHATNYFAELYFGSYLPALLIAMAYTVTQDQIGMQANFFFVTVPAQLTPFLMMGISLLFPGGVYVLLFQVQGLIAAHLYRFLTKIWPEIGGGKDLIPTPRFVSTLWGMLSGAGAIAGRATAAAGGAASGGSTGADRGPLPSSWRSRGPGQRLG